MVEPMLAISHRVARLVTEARAESPVESIMAMTLVLGGSKKSSGFRRKAACIV